MHFFTHLNLMTNRHDGQRHEKGDQQRKRKDKFIYLKFENSRVCPMGATNEEHSAILFRHNS